MHDPDTHLYTHFPSQICPCTWSHTIVHTNIAVYHPRYVKKNKTKTKHEAFPRALRLSFMYTYHTFPLTLPHPFLNPIRLLIRRTLVLKITSV